MKDSMKEVNVTLESITVSLDKVRENYITEEKSSFLGRVKLFFTDKSKVVSLDKQTRFLMSIDEIKLDVEEKDAEIKDLYNTIDALKLALKNSNTEVESLDSTVKSNNEVICNLLKSETKLKSEINDLINTLDIKSSTCNEKSKTLAETLTLNTKLNTKLIDARKTIKDLTDELSELTASFNNKVTTAVRERCKEGGDAILKAYKKAHPKDYKEDHKEEQLEPVAVPELVTIEDTIAKAEFNINKRAVPVVKVVHIRQLLSEGRKKFEIQKAYPEISKSTILRICNNESYTEDIYQYHPSVDVKVVEDVESDTVTSSDVFVQDGNVLEQGVEVKDLTTDTLTPRGENNTMVHMDEVAYIPTPLVGIAVPPRKSYKKKKKIIK